MNLHDPTTQSNYLFITTKHVQLDWTIDFEKKLIFGSATHTLLVKDDAVDEIVFDTLDLEIKSVEKDWQPVPFKLGVKHPVMGSDLRISLPSPIPARTTVNITVHYAMGKDALALQFLDKEQTQGQQYPYLFSQCQPIYARSLAPLQDTPSVKLTYGAKVSATLPVLMSAIRISPQADGPIHAGKNLGKDFVIYEFKQPTPIPSYLIAIACGNVRYKAFSKVEGKNWTSGIWAEPEMIDAAYWEFGEDTGRFLAAEESIVIPYQFGVYDLLVLPPSFPYGGMENACLSFLTPTLLAGDRTLVDVVVHELTHSWFGNGVTHTDASHFWLNEGWTTYIERVLQQVLHSPAHRGFSYLIGYKGLLRSLDEFASRPRYQRMIIDFEHGEDPDDAYSRVPYEKGSNLLLHIERKIGGLAVFLPYVRDYVSTFMGRSINTDTWKRHLYDYWAKHDSSKLEALNSIDWNAWFFGEGLKLPVEMDYDLTLAQEAYELAQRWDASRSQAISDLKFLADDLSDFDSNQKVVFLERLQTYPTLPISHLEYLGSLYGVRTTLNAEIRFRYYELALLNPKADPEGTKAIAHDAAKWLVGEDGSGVIKGRMKFCRPVFRAVFHVDPDAAVNTFQAHRNAFHPIARRLIEKVHARSELLESHT